MRLGIEIWLGKILIALGDLTEAEHFLTDALTVSRSANNPIGSIQALIALGSLACAQGDYDRAVNCLDQALVETKSLRVEDPNLKISIESAVLANLGVAVHGLGNLPEASSYHEAALARQRAVGYLRGEMLSLLDLGDVAREQGDVARASEHYRASLELSWEYGDLRAIIEGIEGLACIAGLTGHSDSAARRFAAAERTRELTGIHFGIAFNRLPYQLLISAIRNDLGEEAFESAWRSGRSLPPSLAVTEALGSATAEAVEPPRVLTPRELDVLRLLVTGMPDREIADELFLSVRTVENHVARILTKLDVRTRTAAATAAIASGFVASPPS